MVKLIKIKKEKRKKENEIPIHNELQTKRILSMCGKMLKVCNEVLEEFFNTGSNDYRKRSQLFDREKLFIFNQNKEIFEIIFGEKFHILSAVTKITSIMKDVSKIAKLNNINIEKEENHAEEEIQEKDLEFLKEILRVNKEREEREAGLELEENEEFAFEAEMQENGKFCLEEENKNADEKTRTGTGTEIKIEEKAEEVIEEKIETGTEEKTEIKTGIKTEEKTEKVIEEKIETGTETEIKTEEKIDIIKPEDPPPVRLRII